MKKTLKEFSNHRGNVSVTFDGLAYNVRYTSYSNMKTGRPEMVRDFGHLDGVMAGEYFAAAKNELKGKNWVEPARRCTYVTKGAKACRRDTCPKKLGGAAYWDIFSLTCPYRCNKTR